MSQPVLERVRAERHRQIQSEGHKPEKDVGRSAELLNAAVVYIEASDQPTHDVGWYDIGYIWPWKPEDFKPESQDRALIKAAALIVAAIEALEKEGNK